MPMSDLIPAQCIVVDLESLGTFFTSQIIQIAAGSVGIPDEKFNILPSVESQVLSITDPQTVNFWQEIQARDLAVWEAVLSPSRFTQSIKDCLEAFSNWIIAYRKKTGIYYDQLHLFSRGKDFDFPMLAWAYSAYLDETPPWFYRNTHCLRDMQFMNATMDDIAKCTPSEGKHNAAYNVAYECRVLRDTFFPLPYPIDEDGRV